jgi:hypothetical protein
MSRHAPQMTLFDDAPPVAEASEPRKLTVSTFMEPNAENFRTWLRETLDMLEGCEASPWNPADARYYRVLFRLRSEWLPAAEGQSLRDAFAGHWERLNIVESRLPS